MEKSNNWRLVLVFIFILLIGAGIAYRLFFLQVLQRKLYKAQAMGQQVTFHSIMGARGQIFCENSQKSKGVSESGEVKSLAINKDNWLISINPNDIVNKEAFAQILSSEVNLTSEGIFSLINTEDTYVVLDENLSSDDLVRIKKLKLKNLSWQNEPDRFYPQGEMASQTIGFLGGEGYGQYGIEGYYDDVLAGKKGMQENPYGINSIFFDSDSILLDGSDIYLTIDYNIQFQAEQLLKEEKKKNDIDSGQIIVMKPDTGKILALANFPNFNPNQYSKQSDLSIFQNSATQKLFEPGSVMKAFTMASAINEGKITPDTTYFDTGIVTIGPDSIHNFNNEKMGEQTMTQALENSLNTGAVFAQQKLDNKTFINYLNKFGFFEKTGVDLQGEVYSQNNNLKKGPDFNFATASFGQGIETTAMQVARAYCALANGGKLVKPYIVEKVIKNQEEYYTEPDISQPIVSQKTISQVNTMLISVVDNGFNKVAKIPGYYLAGKTGTAQVPLKNGKGYEPDKTIQSFVGYGPALDPEFLILVKLDNPKVPKSSLSAVPVFKQLAQYIITYWQIPPDYDVNKK
jgi:cell division protein FtsI/penicillin-binding protein 2